MKFLKSATSFEKDAFAVKSYNTMMHRIKNPNKSGRTVMI